MFPDVLVEVFDAFFCRDFARLSLIIVIFFLLHARRHIIMLEMLKVLLLFSVFPALFLDLLPSVSLSCFRGENLALNVQKQC